MERSWKLNELFPEADERNVQGIFSDSRMKMKNGIFFCLKGLVNDGHQYAAQAVRNGAVCVVYSRDLGSYDPSVFYVRCEDTHEELMKTLQKFYEDPQKKMKFYGVTGTNGKSTISLTVKNLLNHFLKCGYIGTIGVEYGDVKKEMGATTNDLITTYSLLHDMQMAGCDAVSMEVSSHGLDQKRLDGISFDVAVFTNLTHEHLDYHGTMENYFEAKCRLFTGLKDDAVAIINIDDPYGVRLLDRSRGRIVTYALDKKADYQAINLQLGARKSRFLLKTKEGEFPVETNLVARFNISNLLAVIASLHETGYDLKEILPLCRAIPQVDGRIEVLSADQPFNVIIDYAHTPDGFEKIYAYAEAITQSPNKIISVFGSAGLRDTKKRSALGEIADRYSKLIILTEEDPRTEDALEICRQIAAGIKGNYTIITDRYAAIQQAIEIANKGDTILILGKGDEQFMDRDTRSDEWMGDNNCALEILRNMHWEEKDNETEQVY